MNFLEKFQKIDNSLQESLRDYQDSLKLFIIENVEQFKTLYQEKYFDIMNTVYLTLLEDDNVNVPYDELTDFIKKVLQMNPEEIPPQLRDRFSKLKSYHNVRKLIQDKIPIQAEEVELYEKKMTDLEKDKKERIGRALKGNTEYLKHRYGDEWKEVLYAIATKQAMKHESIEDEDLTLTEEMFNENFKGIKTKALVKHVQSHGWRLNTSHKRGEHDYYEYAGNSKSKPKYPIMVPKHNGELPTGTAEKIYKQAIPDNFELWNKKLRLSEEELLEKEDVEKRKGHFKVTFEDGSSVVIHNAHDPEHAEEIAKEKHGKNVTEVNTFTESKKSKVLDMIKEVVNDSIKNPRKIKNPKDAEVSFSGGTTLTKQKRNTIHINPKVKVSSNNK